MKHMTTTLQPPSLLNHQDLNRMKEGRHITTPDFDAYWDHTESTVTYTDSRGELHDIGELYRDHGDALWTFNGKGPGGDNLARGTTPKAAIVAAVHLWENDLVLAQGTNQTHHTLTAPQQLEQIDALYRRWEAQAEFDDKDRDRQDHEYLGEIGAILRLSQSADRRA